MMFSPSLNMTAPFAGVALRDLTKAARGFYVETPIGYRGPYRTGDAAAEALRAMPENARERSAVVWWRGKAQ